MKHWIKRHYLLASLLGALALEAVVVPVFLLAQPRTGTLFSAPLEVVRSLPVYGVAFVLLGLTAAYPLVLTGIQLFLLLRKQLDAC